MRNYSCDTISIFRLATILFVIIAVSVGLAPFAPAGTGGHTAESSLTEYGGYDGGHGHNILNNYSRGQSFFAAGSASAAGTVSQTAALTSGNKLNIDVRGVDLRDVLSALAMNMGADIILLESPGEVTFQVKDVYPLHAFELLLQKESLSYIKDGNIYIVGDIGTLESDFFSRMVLTRFNLRYISAYALEGVLSELNIPLDSVTFDENPQSIWIQAVPVSLAKVRQIIEQVDKPENTDPEVFVSLTRYDLRYISAERLNSIAAELEIPVQSVVLEANPHIIWVHGTHQSKQKMESLIRDVDIPENMEDIDDLTGYELRYIKAEMLDDIVSQVGMDLHTVVLDANPYTLWAHGSSREKKELVKLIAAVDIPDNAEITRPLTRFDLHHVTAANLEAMIGELDIPMQIINIEENNPRVLWGQGPPLAVEKIRELINAVDRFENARENYSVFVYQLKNTVARDIEERLAAFGFSGIETVTFNFSEFGQEILVVAPPHLEDFVYSAINKLDEERLTVRIPVASAEGANARNSLLAQREVLSELTGIPVNRMNVSINLSGDSTEPHFILWVEDTPDNVQKVVEMVEIISIINDP